MKKAFIILISIISIFIIFLCGCGEKEEKIYDIPNEYFETTNFSKPTFTELTLEDGSTKRTYALNIDFVSNISLTSYEIYVEVYDFDNKLIKTLRETKTRSVRVGETISHKFDVDENLHEKAYSVISYYKGKSKEKPNTDLIRNNEKQKLEAPTPKYDMERDVFCWKSIDNVKYYDVKIDDYPIIRTEETYIDVSMLESGTHIVKIRSATDNYFESEASERHKINIKRPIIYFYTDGGSAVANIETKLLTTYPQTQKEGYLFEGWYLDPTLSQAVVYPMEIKQDTIMYAKWLKLKDQKTCKDLSLKFEGSYFYITPNGFDIERLSQLGYNLTITVQYDVYYVKDYDVLWDIGYLGSPKYEVSITNSEGIGQFKNDLSTAKQAKTKTITYKCSAAELKNQSIKLKFSTDNIQNIIYFENIVVTYEFK